VWPRWETFKTQFLSPEGRVIDVGSVDSRTVSEGQSYALFFALVANDPVTFAKVLTWTQDNLAAGDLVNHLPSWLWGQKKDGSWGVLDTNSASDADIWIAYSLLQAGQAWHERRYTALGALLARKILHDESAVLPGLGLSILPAPVGFQISPASWRLNPSYVPLQVLRGLAHDLPDQPQWQQLVAPSLRLLIETAPLGYAPDWAEYHAPDAAASGPTAGKDVAFQNDTKTGAIGSYDAIRVYLWVGMLANTDPERAKLLDTFQPMADYVAAHGTPPERINTETGVVGANAGPFGFSASLLPLLDSLHRTTLADQQVSRLEQLEAHAGPSYFSQVLTLFGTGWHEDRYRFAADGSLRPAWNALCAARTH